MRTHALVAKEQNTDKNSSISIPLICAAAGVPKWQRSEQHTRLT